MIFRAPDYLRKRMLKDAEKLVSDFAFRPQKRLESLHPFKVRNDDATGIAKNVRNYEYFVPALVEYQIGIRRGRTVGALGKDAAFEIAGIFAGNHSIDRARSKNVARQREKLVRIHMIVLCKRAQVTLLDHVLLGGFNVDPFRIVNRSYVIADPDNVDATLVS